MEPDELATRMRQGAVFHGLDSELPMKEAYEDFLRGVLATSEPAPA